MKTKQKHYNIPIFIPQKACPHQCIYCNQRYISGQQKAPSLQEVKQTIEQYLTTTQRDADIQVAFFGGTFTGLDIEEQKSYLEVVKPYISTGKIKSVRLSTRPDYINTQILDLLKQYDVQDIELGAQSLDDEVLKYSERGHTAKDVETASELIKKYGFNLGLQMMIGLPKDTLDKSVFTAKRIVALGAVSTRIYPTLVIERTLLATLYRQGKYEPLSIETAVDWTKEVYKIFDSTNITVLRVGLHPSEDLINGKGYLAGPFHVSFLELVKSALWKDKFENIISAMKNSQYDNVAANDYISYRNKNLLVVKVNPADINYAVGYKSSNLKFLKGYFAEIKFVQDSAIEQNDFQIL